MSIIFVFISYLAKLFALSTIEKEVSPTAGCCRDRFDQQCNLAEVSYEGREVGGQRSEVGGQNSEFGIRNSGVGILHTEDRFGAKVHQRSIERTVKPKKGLETFRQKKEGCLRYQNSQAKI